MLRLECVVTLLVQCYNTSFVFFCLWHFQGLKKKRKIETQEAVNRKLEELDYFFQFLYHTEIDKRNEFFDQCKLTLMATLQIDAIEVAKEAFNEKLIKFGLEKYEYSLFV